MSQGFSTNLSPNIKFGDFDDDDFMNHLFVGPDICLQLPSSWKVYKENQSGKLSFVPFTNSYKCDYLNSLNDVTESSNNEDENYNQDKEDVFSDNDSDLSGTEETVLYNGKVTDKSNGVTEHHVNDLKRLDNDSPSKDLNGSLDPQVELASQTADNTVESSSLNHEEEVDEKQVAETKLPKSLNETKTAPKSVSWAGLFRPNSHQSFNNTATNVNEEKSASPHESPKPIITNATEASSSPTLSPKPDDQLSVNNDNYINANEDKFALLVAEHLNEAELIYKPQAFIPRGFTNSNNRCFINATLQALLVCPPLYQLLKSLPLIPHEKRPKTSTPVIDSFVKLASEFRQLTTKKGAPQSREVPQDIAFSPTYIYKMLAETNPNLFQTGAEGDAEEFLSCVLNGLHEEMKQLLMLWEDHQVDGQLSNGHDSHVTSQSNTLVASGDECNLSLDGWEEVTKKNRSSVTRRADITRSYISDIFRGVLSCTLNYRPGIKAKVIHENFFCLPIDVQAHRTVEDALAALTSREVFNSSGDAQGPVARHQLVENLPPVLILHLKRFVYKDGNPVKLHQELEFKTDLTIEREHLSKQAKKLKLPKRSYKLFAVVNHHGENSTTGHYSTDVFHIGLSSWLRMDDKSIRPVRNIEVTKYNKARSAYLLFYRRTDLG